MAKRMFLVLLLMAALIGGLGFVKYRQVESAIAQGAASNSANGCYDGSREAGNLALHLVGDRHGSRDSGGYGERRSARHDRQDSF